MVPLITYEQELELMRELVERVVEDEGGSDLPLLLGTMIELPRACFVADRIAARADFFSFGTNDLTQTALGFSRDDVGGMLARYMELKIVERSPFETIDAPGVGWLVRLAAWVGREAKPDLKLGICGEHGGDPDSIAFFQIAGLDYVSCSPYRVPIARVAAAQSAIRASSNPERRLTPHRAARIDAACLRSSLGLLSPSGWSGSSASRCPRWRRARIRRGESSMSRTPITARRFSATATGSCTRRPSGA